MLKTPKKNGVLELVTSPIIPRAKPRKLPTFKKILSETCGNSKEIFRAESRFAKVLWLIIFLLTLCACMYESFSLMIEFAEKPVVSTYTRIYKQVQDFPQITICTYSRLNVTKFRQDYYPSDDLISYIFSVFSGKSVSQ